MEDATLQNCSQYLIYFGVILTFFGGIGVKIYGDRIAKGKDEKIAKQQLEISEIREHTKSIKQSVQERGFTEEQQIALSDALSKMKHTEITIVAVSGDSEAEKYAIKLKSIFLKSGWKTSLSTAMYPGLDKDLVLFCQDKNDLQICKEIKEAFQSNSTIVQILPNRGAAISFGKTNFKPKLVVGHKANLEN